MHTLTDRTISALRATHDDLAARVAAFDAPDLARSSGASEWDVAQVLSHLGSAAEIMLETLRAMARGEDVPGQELNQSVWDRWNAKSREQQAADFAPADAALVEALEALDDAARREQQVKLGFLPAPVGIDVLAGMRLNEVVLHSWDVRVGFDDDAVLPAAEAATLLDLFAGPLGFLLGFFGKPEALGAEAGSEVGLRVTTTEPDRSFGLLLAPQVGLGDVSVPDGELHAPGEAVLRLLFGRLDADHTPRAVSLEGDTLTLETLRRVFPGM